MKPHFTGLAGAALLVIASTFPSLAQNTAAPAQTEAPPPSATPPTVPRPSIMPKTEEPASAPVTAEAAPRPRRAAHRHRQGYGPYRTAYWEPFPIYWPHLYHNRIHWNRIPWTVRF